MKRRDLVMAVGSAAAWPTLARAQASSMPVIGFLHNGSAQTNAKRVDGLRKGLAEAGLVEGQNVAIEWRWAQGDDGRLGELAADLVQRKVSIIVALSSTAGAVAAKRATSTIPIYFLIAEPPVELGLVASLSRPGGNATGMVTLAAELAAKRLSLLRELVPQAPAMAALVRAVNPSVKRVTAGLGATARQLGVRLDIHEATTQAEIDKAYAGMRRGVPLLVATDPFFFAQRAQLVALSAQYALPTIYDSRESTEIGGLVSYGPNHLALWQQAGGHIARIIKGQKPAALPVMQASIFDLVVNQKTAKSLGLTIPSAVIARADDVIG